MSVRIAVPLAALGALLTGVVAVGACTLLLAFAVAGGAEHVALGGTLAGGGDLAGAGTVGAAVAPSATAEADIPPLYLALYMQAAARFGLDWAVLAGIGRVECDHGRDPAPSCTVEGQLNSAGAGGPAQFLVSTWQRYGISASGQGPPDMWNPADAIFSMANYLRASGAPESYRLAIYAYNHAWWYVADVLTWARAYSARYVAPPQQRPAYAGLQTRLVR
jgi:membrane-bound lytic murein transglycosylase B